MSHLDPPPRDDDSPRSFLKRLFPRRESAESKPAESKDDAIEAAQQGPSKDSAPGDSGQAASGLEKQSASAALSKAEQGMQDARDTAAKASAGASSDLPSDRGESSDSESSLPTSPGDSAMILRGTSRGLEVQIQKDPPEAEILAEQFQQELSRSPEFFSGGDVILRFSNAPDPGTITALEKVAREFSLRIVALSSEAIEDAQPSAPKLSSRRPKSEQKTPSPYPLPVTRFMETSGSEERNAISPIAPMMVAGPIRSGACFEAPGHLVVVGDVNPGAEIRAAGNIVVLGSLRGIAHAGREGHPSFILALQLQPQQLRIGDLIARAADADGPASGAEIAYADDKMIVVDEYQGRLPANISSNI